ncbi:MAG TPA: hypothetical protein VGC54_12580 [Planctomycetota bacterium]
MASLTPRCVFVHVPKTGGQWVHAALGECGLLTGTLGVVHASPDEIRASAAWAARPTRFAFVRSPLRWYPSMWAHRMDDQWLPIDSSDWFSARWLKAWAGFTERCRAEDFEDFVVRCTRAFPDGWLAALYREYLDGVMAVGRQEHLADDLVRILREAGEDFDETALRATPARNVRAGGGSRRRSWAWTPALLALVAECEHAVFARFGYPVELP